MRIALIADTFPPLATSGSVQLRDLSREFARQGHDLTVFLPSAQKEAWSLENIDGFQVLRLKAPKSKEIGYVRRTLAEFVMPFSMLRQFRKSPLFRERWDGVVWYSPSIFHGPLVSSLKKINKCKGYLIIRDIFPEWAYELGLMGSGLPYRFFSTVARYQYSIADVIGVQSPGNFCYFDHWLKKPGRKLEVLQNWLSCSMPVRCSIRIDETHLAGRKIFVYAGNMGVAQGLSIMLDLAEQLYRKNRTDIGFVFVGRGSDADRLRSSARERSLDNVLFYDEILPDEIPDLYAQCSVGVVALDPRHKSHNIPGKFLTYMQCGLPVLANINPGNDLAKLIRKEEVGQVCESNQLDELLVLTDKLLTQINAVPDYFSSRCHRLFEREFSVDRTVRQIVSALEK